jgi:hypothetical protein
VGGGALVWQVKEEACIWIWGGFRVWLYPG